MKRALASLAAIVLFGPAAQAQVYPVGACGPQGCGQQSCGPMGCYPVATPQMVGMGYPGCQGPINCSPGFYVINPQRWPYVGPYYPCQPPMPFNGMLPKPDWMGQGGGAGWPTHPYARGPRDYFMVREMTERE